MSWVGGRSAAAMEKFTWPILALLSAVYFAGGAIAAGSEPYSFDEYFTLDLTRLPTAGAEWNALMRNADFTPPLFHLLTRASFYMLRHSSLGLRLPALIGFWLLCLSLFLFVRRALGSALALAAFLIPLLTGATPYALEARGYAAMFGFCGLSLLAWQRRSPTGFVLSFGAATMCHPSAIFALIPFMAAEVARYTEIQPLHGMWWPFAASLAPLALFSAHLFSSGSFIGSGALRGSDLEPASLALIPEAYSALLETWWPAMALLALLLFVSMVYDKAEGGFEYPIRRPTAPELTLGIGFALLPVSVVASTAFIHGYFHYRYSALAAVGVDLLVVFAIASSRTHFRTVTSLAVPVLMLCFVKIERPLFHRATTEPTVSFAAVSDSQDPIYFAQPQSFLDLVHRWPPSLARRIRYVAGPTLAGSAGPSHMFDMLLCDLAPYTPFQVVNYQSLRSSGRDFLLFAEPGNLHDPGWLLNRLIDDGVPMELIEQKNFLLLFRVHQS